MESEGHRSYSVLTKQQVRAKMEKEIDEISEFFSVSKSAATVMLLSQRWHLFRVSDRLGDDKDKFLEESGLRSDGLNRDESTDSTCGICFESSSTDETRVLISTPFCSHHFCTACWSEYLGNSLENDQSGNISCPDPDCHAAVGPDTIQQLPETVKKMYRRYVLRSYMESNKKLMKWCPARNCKYAIELQDHSDEEEGNFSVVCLCAHAFCWNCELESHRPVTCNNAFDWNRVVGVTDESLSVAWIADNTKPCPSCFRSVDGGGCNFLKCASPCGFHFCWKCLRSVEDHVGDGACFEAFVPPGAPSEMFNRWESAVSSHQNRSLHQDCFEEGHRAMQQAISDLREIEKSKMAELGKKFATSKRNMGFVRDAWMLIVQCRQILKWSYVYDSFLTEYESAKKHYLHHLQEEAIDTLYRYSETVKTETEQALVAGTSKDLGCFRRKLSDMTSTTGNYFHHFVKTLEDGIPVVKVTSYDDVAGNHWFCDRCTYQNSWLDKECNICCDALASLCLSD